MSSPVVMSSMVMSASPTWLAAGPSGGDSSMAGRIVLVAVAVVAVGAFTVLQIMARSGRRRPPAQRRRRRYDPSDWRVPPPCGTAGGNDEAPSGNAEQHRPDWRYGYPPGYDQGLPPRGAVRGEARRDRGR
jgi:hypothetical protein